MVADETVQWGLVRTGQDDTIESKCCESVTGSIHQNADLHSVASPGRVDDGCTGLAKLHVGEALLVYNP